MHPRLSKPRSLNPRLSELTKAGILKNKFRYNLHDGGRPVM